MKAVRVLCASILVAAVLQSPVRAHAAEPAHAPAVTNAAAVCPPEETRSEVPALTEFHQVIARLWHEAWPNKQMEVMRSMVPDIVSGAAKVAAAKLPGVLREKQAAWDAGLEQLRAAVSDYVVAAQGSDDPKLLEAGEKLHARFEALVRVTRPAIKELDAFHAVLYRLYHYDLPANDRAAIRVSVADLKEPLAALNKASLPERFKAKQKEFGTSRRKLSAAVDRLALAVRTEDDARIKRAVEDMHERYQALSAVFE